MFTAHAWDLAEAQLGESERNQRATFEGFRSKPFDLDVLVSTVDGVLRDPVCSALCSSTWRAQILDR